MSHHPESRLSPAARRPPFVPGRAWMANWITTARLALLFVVIWLIYVGPVPVIEACMLLIIVVFASDGIDGWVARKRNETST
ncbi:MAG: CDP-alcohol phosphatidyltransferase family protein, partial [Thermomicrobiales bacterium]